MKTEQLTTDKGQRAVAEAGGAYALAGSQAGLKPGYKMTEVGVLPEDWEVKELNALTVLMTNGFVGTVKSDYVETEEGVLYIQGYNVEPNGFNFNGIKRVSKEFHSRNAKSGGGFNWFIVGAGHARDHGLTHWPSVLRGHGPLLR